MYSEFSVLCLVFWCLLLLPQRFVSSLLRGLGRIGRRRAARARGHVCWAAIFLVLLVPRRGNARVAVSAHLLERVGGGEGPAPAAAVPANVLDDQPPPPNGEKSGSIASTGSGVKVVCCFLL